MYVCICNAFTERQVRTALDQGVRSPAGVFRARKCAPQCGKCVPTLRQMVDRHQAQSVDAELALPLAAE
ncbi:(2Fe-2S)-binding protein [Arenibaculum pallidiluteum]|uniref:(2Fe-2S)-binding protein n=1 Tax=Arenibaculum pallidiluteum TaxID=2812559 RepID=UPI001A96D603|nr:(2Fe-2S)-binding protein [Arenibaculum pallidiluteum]